MKKDNPNKIEGLGERIRQLRGKITQKEFGALFGASQNVISQYEKNERLPPARFLIQVMIKTGKNIEWLLMGDNFKELKVEENRAVYEKLAHTKDKEIIENFNHLSDEGKRVVEEVLAGRLLLEGKEYQRLSDETKPKQKLKSTA